MKKENALWIDHQQAGMVITLNQTQDIHEPNPIFIGVNPSLDDTSAILILEPSEARLSFKNPIRSKDSVIVFLLSNLSKQ